VVLEFEGFIPGACHVTVFVWFVNTLSRYLTVSGSTHGIEHDIQGVRVWNHTLFCDDLTQFAQTEEVIQTRQESVSVFEDWSGLPVKLKKYYVMRVGGQIGVSGKQTDRSVWKILEL
jgi:hypothetical protein